MIQQIVESNPVPWSASFGSPAVTFAAVSGYATMDLSPLLQEHLHHRPNFMLLKRLAALLKGTIHWLRSHLWENASRASPPTTLPKHLLRVRSEVWQSFDEPCSSSTSRGGLVWIPASIGCWGCFGVKSWKEPTIQIDTVQVELTTLLSYETWPALEEPPELPVWVCRCGPIWLIILFPQNCHVVVKFLIFRHTHVSAFRAIMCGYTVYRTVYPKKKKVNTYLYIYSMCTWGNCDKTTINYENKLLWLWYIINYDKLLQGCSIFRQTHQVMPQRLRRRLRRELLERLAVWCSM